MGARDRVVRSIGTVVTLTATVLVGQSVTWDGCMAHAMLPNVCTVVVQGAPYVTAMFN